MAAFTGATIARADQVGVQIEEGARIAGAETGEMPLPRRPRVLGVLSHPALAPIGFEMYGLVVTGVRYSVVRQAIQSGKITCTAGPVPDADGRAGYVTQAKYLIRQNILAFPSENFASYRGDEMCTVVHEATHAMCDVFAKSKEDKILAIRDEACATLAEMLFYRLSGVKHAPSGLKEVGSASYAALKLADVILSKTGNFRKMAGPIS